MVLILIRSVRVGESVIDSTGHRLISTDMSIRNNTIIIQCPEIHWIYRVAFGSLAILNWRYPDATFHSIRQLIRWMCIHICCLWWWKFLYRIKKKNLNSASVNTHSMDLGYCLHCSINHIIIHWLDVSPHMLFEVLKKNLAWPACLLVLCVPILIRFLSSSSQMNNSNSKMSDSTVCVYSFHIASTLADCSLYFA